MQLTSAGSFVLSMVRQRSYYTEIVFSCAETDKREFSLTFKHFHGNAIVISCSAFIHFPSRSTFSVILERHDLKIMWNALLLGRRVGGEISVEAEWRIMLSVNDLIER